MEPIRNFWVVGGDQRQVWLARLLAEDGHTVHTYALDLPPDAGDGPVARSSLETVSYTHLDVYKRQASRS